MKTLTKFNKLTSEYKAYIEVAMMTGRSIPINNQTLAPAIRYCLPAIVDDHKADFDAMTADIVDDALNRYTDDSREVVAISFCTVDDMLMINFIFNDDQEPTQFSDLAGEKEVFAYTYNATYPDFSEFGYLFYKNHKRMY